MRLIEDFNAPPTLGFLMVTRTVIWVWNRPVIVRSISQMLDIVDERLKERMWEKIIDHVRAIVRNIVDVPEVFRKDLDAVIIPIGFHIREMRTFVNFSPYFPSGYFEFPVYFWTPYGTVDKTQLDALLVRDKRMLIGFRYNLACHDCFADIVEGLFQLLTPAQVYYFLQMEPQKELSSYWTHRMINALFNFVSLNIPLDVGRGQNVAHKLAFKYTLKDGSKSGIKYFLDTLPLNDFEYVTISFLFYLVEGPYTHRTRSYFLPITPEEHYNDSTYFLLSRLDEEQRNAILPGRYTAVMLNFLKYPFYGLFSRYGKIWRSHFSWKDLNHLLIKILILRSLNTNFFEYHLFADLWRSCPEAYKLAIRNWAIERSITGDPFAGLMLELMRDSEGKKETLEWCMKAKLIASRYECPRCKKNMRLQKGTVDGYKWRCRNQSKDNRHDVVRSVRKGTWFSESKLAITIIFRLTRYWFGKSMNAFVVNDLKVNKNMRQS
ncbi:uncharacterized protein TNCV_2857391 [Trichonephila clavipes]|nr:uncharacterized protein TNCV_2857391 [Trichonephila clavipes]